jgi:hypothetical protein
MTKEWKDESFISEKGYTRYRWILYIDGVRTNRRRKEVLDTEVCCNDCNDIMIEDFLYEFRAFVDDTHHIRLITDQFIGIFHYEEYTEGE